MKNTCSNTKNTSMYHLFIIVLLIFSRKFISFQVNSTSQPAHVPDLHSLQAARCTSAALGPQSVQLHCAPGGQPTGCKLAFRRGVWQRLQAHYVNYQRLKRQRRYSIAVICRRFDLLMKCPMTRLQNANSLMKFIPSRQFLQNASYGVR